MQVSVRLPVPSILEDHGWCDTMPSSPMLSTEKTQLLNRQQGIFAPPLAAMKQTENCKHCLGVGRHPIGVFRGK
tara:strand:- start:1441 stop:1662 length:222 start_codon:yes stop_codon:yes gene_type:complete